MIKWKVEQKVQVEYTDNFASNEIWKWKYEMHFGSMNRKNPFFKPVQILLIFGNLIEYGFDEFELVFTELFL